MKKVYPRLQIRKFAIPVALPWHVEKLYGPAPYNRRHLVAEAAEFEDARLIVEGVMDGKLSAEGSWLPARLMLSQVRLPE